MPSSRARLWSAALLTLPKRWCPRSQSKRRAPGRGRPQLGLQSRAPRLPQRLVQALLLGTLTRAAFLRPSSSESSSMSTEDAAATGGGPARRRSRAQKLRLLRVGRRAQRARPRAARAGPGSPLFHFEPQRLLPAGVHGCAAVCHDSQPALCRRRGLPRRRSRGASRRRSRASADVNASRDPLRAPPARSALPLAALRQKCGRVHLLLGPLRACVRARELVRPSLAPLAPLAARCSDRWSHRGPPLRNRRLLLLLSPPSPSKCQTIVRHLAATVNGRAVRFGPCACRASARLLGVGEESRRTARERPRVSERKRGACCLNSRVLTAAAPIIHRAP